MSKNLTHIFLAKLRNSATRQDVLGFLRNTAQMLPRIDGVQNFRMYERSTADNEYLFYMEFKDQKAYELYDTHLQHEQYVREVWSKVAGTVEVIDLHEINAENLLSEGGYNG